MGLEKVVWGVHAAVEGRVLACVCRLWLMLFGIYDDKVGVMAIYMQLAILAYQLPALEIDFAGMFACRVCM